MYVYVRPPLRLHKEQQQQYSQRDCTIVESGTPHGTRACPPTVRRNHSIAAGQCWFGNRKKKRKRKAKQNKHSLRTFRQHYITKQQQNVAGTRSKQLLVQARHRQQVHRYATRMVGNIYNMIPYPTLQNNTNAERHNLVHLFHAFSFVSHISVTSTSSLVPPFHPTTIGRSIYLEIVWR